MAAVSSPVPLSPRRNNPQRLIDSSTPPVRAPPQEEKAKAEKKAKLAAMQSGQATAEEAAEEKKAAINKLDAAPSGPGKMFKAVVNMRVRETMSGDAEIVGDIEREMVVKVLEENGDWARVHHHAKASGWILTKNKGGPINPLFGRVA